MLDRMDVQEMTVVNNTLNKRCYTKTTMNSHAPIWNAYAIMITDLDGVITMDTLDAIVGFVVN